MVLVDEYDKPILDALENREVARANRDFLRGLYGVIRRALLLRRRQFARAGSRPGRRRSWCKKLFERRVSFVSLDEMVSTERLLSAFDVEQIGTEALLFQTGYLTITGEERAGGKTLYRLGYPNPEVCESLNEQLLLHLVQDTDQQMANSMRLARPLEAHDSTGLKGLFHAFYASIPYQWFTNNAIAEYEGFYASAFYSYFAALGYEIVVEESSSHGRLTWRCERTGTCTCSSSRWRRWHRRDRRWRSCRSATTRRSPGDRAHRSTW